VEYLKIIAWLVLFFLFIHIVFELMLRGCNKTWNSKPRDT